MTLVFSFTNGREWDGDYTLKFKVPKPWLNKPLSFFNEVGFHPASTCFAFAWCSYLGSEVHLWCCWLEGVAEELNMEGACE